jgi:2-oxoglutarate dehydrogenase E1 component
MNINLSKGDSATVKLRDVESKLQSIYCDTIGYQYMHIANFAKNSYIRHKIESQSESSIQITTSEEKLRILDRLLWAEEFENFLDIKYPAQKRFGVSGSESFVPLLKEIIDEGARLGIKDFVIGMPHRGRLIFLATVLRKPLSEIFYEFRGLALPNIDIELLESGDVKYHLGASIDRHTPDELSVHLSLFPNPSHLEAVDSVVLGKTRAKQYFNSQNQNQNNSDSDVKVDEVNNRRKTCAILIHGDASFAGQGVVYESMALTDLPNYTTGGVIHVIVNNQIGFTTDAFESRSSPYCTDIARSVAAPIMHVNGDDPEACAQTARLAMQYRQQFDCDAVIDMLCFRRYGHNEGDEPMFTQPLMYSVIAEKIRTKNTCVANYERKLLQENCITREGDGCRAYAGTNQKDPK